MTVLALGAHTDDIELGCGGTLQKYDNVIYVAFSACGNFELIEECKRSTFILGIKETIIFNQEVRNFDKSRQEILDLMLSLKKKYDPQIVFTHNLDCHQDHHVIHNESVRAFFKDTMMFGYELPWNRQAVMSNTFKPITGDQLSKKVKALSRYKTQAHRPYMNTNFITSLATVRGVQAGCEYAEAFETIRGSV